MLTKNLLSPAWFPLFYHEKQAKLWRTKSRFVAVAAGRGSGKTELARRRIIRYLPIKKEWYNPIYAYCLPTYKQARRVAWRPLKDLIPKDWIVQTNETEMRVDTIFGSSLYVVGMDKPQRIEGSQWDGIVLDEACDQKPGSFDLSILPALSHRAGWCFRIGVPKRTGVGASEFKIYFFEGAEESYTWPSEDILTEEQLKYARQTLDPRDYNEQYRASWESNSGLIFFAFDQVLNVNDQITYDPNEVLIIGSDFNVDPMCWVIGQYRKDKKRLEIFDEIFIRNTNTRETLDALYKKYGQHKAGFDFFGDAAGRARSTKASESDYIQIRNDKRFLSARVHYPRKNPRIANRFSVTNSAFCNAEGNRRLYVHPRCTHLIRDLTSRAYKPGSNEPDDYGDIGHISDAIGYACWKIFPLHVIRKSVPAVISRF